MRVALFGLVLIGCGFHPGAGTDGGGDDGRPDTPPGMCDQASWPRCAGTELEVCVDGLTQVTDCPFACIEGPARCGDPRPSNGVDPAAVPPSPMALVIPAGQTWVADSSTGRIHICGGLDVRMAVPGVDNGIAFQQTGTNPGVFALGSISVAATGKLRVIGDVPGVFLTAGAIEVAGSIDASGGIFACDMTAACGIAGDRRCSGPGPGLGGSFAADGEGPGHGVTGQTTGNEHGSGGGSFGSAGGKGGGGNGGLPGPVYGAPELVPLAAGSGGAGGGGGNNTTNFGGGGGGGLQLTALGTMTISGTVRSSGGGGGYGNNTFSHGGGGGGSGGAILLEALAISITGAVTANGGGGGAGDAPVATTSNGQDGRADGTSAAGGTGNHPGGAGAVANMPTGVQGDPQTSNTVDGTGGGGGGMGRIYFRSRAGGVSASTALVSPVAGTGSDYVQ